MKTLNIYNLRSSVCTCVGIHLFMLSHLQKSCIDFAIQAKPLERYMPKDRSSVKYKIWRVVVSTPFEYFIMLLIVFNTLLLMMKVRFPGL